LVVAEVIDTPSKKGRKRKGITEDWSKRTEERNFAQLDEAVEPIKSISI
jgi:hypothetical protein